MSEPRLLRPGTNCWRIEKAGRFAVIIDGCDYFRAVKRAIAKARQQVLMIGWDFDTRIELEPDEAEIEGPNQLGDFLNWVTAERPDVDLKILKWDLGVIETLKRGEMPLFILNWMTRSDISLQLDTAHPPVASHHQKLIVVDDRVAFCGGIDITKGRWDTREHRAENPHRRAPGGELLDPWHDATTCVDGAVARAVGELGRMRWKRATGDDLAVPACGGDPWPEHVRPRLRDVYVAISRTMGAFGDYEQVSEIERLKFDVIAKARKTLYIESQYFASRKLAEAMARRLSERDGPEIVLINPQSQDGWLEEKTMGTARARLVRLVRQADVHDRFRIFHPFTSGRKPVYVHAKIMVADDGFLKLGSANFNNRSMGLDTECDLSIEAGPGQAGLRRSIARVRDDLVSEHLGVEISAFQARLEETGSLIAAIETFASGKRGLSVLKLRDIDGVDAAFGENDLLDPERPAQLADRIRRWAGLA